LYAQRKHLEDEQERKMREMNAYKSVVWKCKGRRPHKRPRLRWGTNHILKLKSYSRNSPQLWKLKVHYRVLKSPWLVWSLLCARLIGSSQLYY